MEIEPFSGALGLFGIFFVIAALVVAAGFVFVIVAIVRNARKVSASGQDPLTLQSDLAVRAMNSQLLAPGASTEARLAEVDDLRSRGVISAEEHTAARAKILGGS